MNEYKNKRLLETSPASARTLHDYDVKLQVCIHFALYDGFVAARKKTLSMWQCVHNHRKLSFVG
jgi:hypothetical protein